MKIKYATGFHGYNSVGFPIITDEANAAKFKNKEAAMIQVSHDGYEFGFWMGGFQLV